MLLKAVFVTVVKAPLLLNSSAGTLCSSLHPVKQLIKVVTLSQPANRSAGTLWMAVLLNALWKLVTLWLLANKPAGTDFRLVPEKSMRNESTSGLLANRPGRDGFERLGVGEQRVEGRHLLVVGEEFFGNRLQFAVREDDRTVGQLRVAREEILVDLGDRRAGEERTYRGDLRAVVKQVGGHFGDHVAVLEAVGEGFRLGCMVEQPVGNGFEDAAVGECIVEGGDLGEGFGVVGGNPFQLAAVLECARHRGQPRAAPVVNLPELVAQSVVGDVVGVERRHAALDRDDVVARVGVGVRGVGRGDVLLESCRRPSRWVSRWPCRRRRSSGSDEVMSDFRG